MGFSREVHKSDSRIYIVLSIYVITDTFYTVTIFTMVIASKEKPCFGRPYRNLIYITVENRKHNIVSKKYTFDTNKNNT